MTIDKPKNPGGRPTTYNEQIATDICNAIAATNCGLETICKIHPKFPNARAVYEWLNKYPEFAQKYAEAKKNQIEVFINDINDLANEPHDFIDEKGQRRIDASVLRSKIDSRKWMASKLVPKLYGEKMHNETTVIIKHEDALKELE
jgi:disulfide oxidoreductase YuzD